MTWEEFKRKAEELGIKEQDVLRWIDVNGAANADEVAIARDKEGRVAIYT